MTMYVKKSMRINQINDILGLNLVNRCLENQDIKSVTGTYTGKHGLILYQKRTPTYDADIKIKHAGVNFVWNIKL